MDSKAFKVVLMRMQNGVTTLTKQPKRLRGEHNGAVVGDKLADGGALVSLTEEETLSLSSSSPTGAKGIYFVVNASSKVVSAGVSTKGECFVRIIMVVGCELKPNAELSSSNKKRENTRKPTIINSNNNNQYGVVFADISKNRVAVTC